MPTMAIRNFLSIIYCPTSSTTPHLNLYTSPLSPHTANPSSPNLNFIPLLDTQPLTLPGTPVTNAYAGTSLVTTLPAPTNAYSPILTPHTTVTFPPNDAPRPTTVSLYSDLRLMNARGFTTLVNTADGPTNTPSSSRTPSYTVTLFCIRQPSPTHALPITTTF